jgi:hypothetical protein
MEASDRDLLQQLDRIEPGLACAPALGVVHLVERDQDAIDVSEIRVLGGKSQGWPPILPRDRTVRAQYPA